MNGEAAFGGDKQCRTPRGAEDDGGAHILHIDDSFDGKAGRRVIVSDARKRFVDGEQTFVRGDFGRIFDDSIGDGAHFAASCFNNGIARSPQGRIYGQDAFGCHGE